MNFSGGLSIIKEFEGCALRSYQDSGGLWTIGYGHTHGVGPETTCDGSQALEWFTEDCNDTITHIQNSIRVSLNENQWSALLSFCFNEGVGHLEGSTLLKLLNSWDFHAAANEFPKWDKCRGQVVAGLLRRRMAEQALFLKAVLP